MITMNEKYNVIEDLKRKAAKNNILFQAEIDVTYSCNAKCPFCFEGKMHYDTRPKLSLSKINTILDELKELGTLYVGFSGGEPFLRADFLEILRLAKEKGFFVSFVSNLQLPTKEQIEELINLGVDRIVVSFHSADMLNYCKIFGVAKEFYIRAINNIKMLIAAKQSVGIAVTTFNDNYFEMQDIMDFFLKLGLNKNDVNFNLLVQGKNDTRNQRMKKGVNDYLKCHPTLKDRVLVKATNTFLCSAGKTSCTIGPYGDVYPCTFFNMSAGNLFDHSLKEIWETSHLFKLMRLVTEDEFNKCTQCHYSMICSVCMAANLNETGLYNVPSEEYCEFRKEIAKSFEKTNIEEIIK